MDTWGLLASIGISFGASFLFAYILYWLDLYEKEPLLLLGGVFAWGVIVAAGGAFIINTIIGVGIFVVTGSEIATNLTTSAVIAPVIEEILKGLAVVLVFLIFKHEFDSILDGIIYAGVTALGFAAAENAYYIYVYGFAEEGWQGFRSLALIRLGLVGWQHPFYTAFVGIGLALARLNRNVIVKLISPALGLGAAIAAHALHNLLATLFQSPGGILFTTALDWLGWLLMLGFVILVMFVERHKIKKYLQLEVERGTLTKDQFESTYAIFKIIGERIKAIFKGKYFITTRFYRTAAELALKKDIKERLGEEPVRGAGIQDLRDRLKGLSPTI
jgi:protease PrsW